MGDPIETNGQFVSYAQNFEDVILWRALKHVSSGYYVDIGAQDPVVDSVSMAFYEHGWRGAHVEPNQNYAERLRMARPDECVIEAAVGTTVGKVAFFDIPDTGLSTGDASLAEEHKKRGFVINHVDVPCMRLSDIFDQLDASEIHWLKIDVEGMEQQVIASWEPSTRRPWIVVVESTLPNTTISNFSSWENSLVKLGYEFLYFDGLNRFYVSNQHPELKDRFGPGPNIFDGFTLSGFASAPFCSGLLKQAEARQHEAELRVKQAEARQHEAELRVKQAEARQHEAELRVKQAEARQHEAELRVKLIYASRSWRITRILRSITDVMRWMRTDAQSWLTWKPGGRPRRIARHCLYRVAVWVRTDPRRYFIVIRCLRRLPWLEMRMRASFSSERPKNSRVFTENTETRATKAEPLNRQTDSGSHLISAKVQAVDLPCSAAKIYEQLLRARLDRNNLGEKR